MMLTENEARAMLCPMTLMQEFGEDDKATVGISGACCVGAHCMAWRWAFSKERGFCGMAGLRVTQDT